jgi:hypothetical protein
LSGVVPAESFEALRTALGEPRVLTYPTGHESFVYALPLAVDSALEWIAGACLRR